MTKEKTLFSRKEDRKMALKVIGLVLIVFGIAIIFPFLISMIEVIIGLFCIIAGAHLFFGTTSNHWFR